LRMASKPGFTAAGRTDEWQCPPMCLLYGYCSIFAVNVEFYNSLI
jgi:hypothetical protein